MAEWITHTTSAFSTTTTKKIRISWENYKCCCCCCCCCRQQILLLSMKLIMFDHEFCISLVTVCEMKNIKIHNCIFELLFLPEDWFEFDRSEDEINALVYYMTKNGLFAASFLPHPISPSSTQKVINLDLRGYEQL